MTVPVPPLERIDLGVWSAGRCGSVAFGRAADGPFGSTPALSPDGGWLAFASQDPSLSAEDQDDGRADVFLTRAG